jgi:hypothetical protein
MYYRAEGDKEEGSRTRLGVRPKIQDLNRTINFLDPR